MCSLKLDWIGINNEIWDSDSDNTLKTETKAFIKKKKKELKLNYLCATRLSFFIPPNIMSDCKEEAADVKHRHTVHDVTHCWHDPLLTTQTQKLTQLNFWLSAPLPKRQSTKHLPEFIFWANVFKESRRGSECKSELEFSTELLCCEVWGLTGSKKDVFRIWTLRLRNAF